MHVAVFGAGYAGVSLVGKLESALPPDVDITLVDEGETHLVQHLIHRIVRKPSLADNLRVPIDQLVSRAEHVRARVTGLDPDSGTAEFETGSLSYDVGAVCLGARTAFYGLEGVETHATPLKRPEDAQQIREAFEAVRETGGRVVVGGAGLSGVQVTGELAELAAEAETDIDVVLLEQKPTVVPQFPDRFQEAVTEELVARDVDIRTSRTVAGADDSAVEFAGGATLGYDQFVWAGGIAGQAAVGDRPETNATLRLGERTFAAGDAARVVDSDGEPVPASAQTAVRQADVAATNVERLCDHYRSGGGFEPRLDRYRYRSLGWLVSVGDGTVAQVGPSVFSGRAAETLKTGVGVGYLTNIGAVEDAVEYVERTLATH